MSSNSESSVDPEESGDGGSGQEEDESGEENEVRSFRNARWPADKITVTALQADGMPADEKAKKRFKKLAGLIARQRISLLTESMRDVKTPKRWDIFNRWVLKNLEFPDERNKRKAFKKMWSKITKCRSDFKSNLTTKFVAKGLLPFQQYKFLDPNDWEQFITQRTTQAAINRSERAKELRAMSKYNHHLGPGGYEVALKKWAAEDAKLAAEGKPNPFHMYPSGRPRNFLRARAQVTDSGEISFISSNVKEVEQKILDLAEQANEGSFTGVREHDILTAALGNPEHTGRVRGVSSYSGWDSWPGCEKMFRQNKEGNMNAEAVESLIQKRLAEQEQTITAKLSQQMAQQMAEMFRAHGMGSRPPSPAAGHLTSQSSIGVHDMLMARNPNLTFSDFGDIVDKLQEPTPCILQVIDGVFRRDAAKAIVLPSEAVCHCSEVDLTRYAVVSVDQVFDEYKDHAVPVPPNDEITTLEEALLQRIQWKRDLIVTSTCSSPSHHPPPPPPPQDASKEVQTYPEEVTTANEASKKRSLPSSQQHMSDGSKKQASASGPKKTSSVHNKPPKAPMTEKAVESKDMTKYTKKWKKPTKRNNEVASVWTKPHPKFKYGAPIASPQELEKQGVKAQQLHKWYLNACKAKKTTITLLAKATFFLKGSVDYVPVNFSDLYDLYHHTALDVSIIRVFSLKQNS